MSAVERLADERHPSPARFEPLVERMAVGHHRACLLVGPEGLPPHDLDDHRHAQRALLAADPDLAAALELGLAWQAAEAALPEGWLTIELQGRPGKYLALAHETMDDAAEYWREGTTATGATPAAALRNLAAKLGERP